MELPFSYRTMGPKVGRCNICGALGNLTEDHVPPKGCVTPRPVIIGNILDRTRAMAATLRGIKAQHGVIFRTLCESCNSDVLGTRYDPDLISMSEQVAALIDFPLYIPSSSTIRIRPQRVARSVLGHLMAVGLDRYDGGEMASGLRDCILDPGVNLPSELKLYYWVYKRPERVLIRDAGVMTLHTRGTSFFWLMKFYPLAFMAVWDGALQVPNLRTFDPYRSHGPEDYADVIVDLEPVPNPYFPEVPMSADMLLMGRDAIVMVDRPFLGRPLKGK